MCGWFLIIINHQTTIHSSWELEWSNGHHHQCHTGKEVVKCIITFNHSSNLMRRYDYPTLAAMWMREKMILQLQNWTFKWYTIHNKALLALLTPESLFSFIPGSSGTNFSHSCTFCLQDDVLLVKTKAFTPIIAHIVAIHCSFWHCLSHAAALNTKPPGIPVRNKYIYLSAVKV